MRYHEADYVGNLGLDHRNGWLSAGGLVVVGLSLVLLGVFAVMQEAGLDESERDVAEEEEALSSDGEKRLSSSSYASPSSSSSSSSFEDEKGERKLEQGMGIDPPLQPNPTFALDWTTLSELLYATAIHQLLLKITNHFVPLTAFLRSWPMLLGSCLLAWYLCKKRGAQYETMACCFALAFVAATVATQLGTDLGELYDVSRGVVQRYNYRWAVKDWFSARGASG